MTRPKELYQIEKYCVICGAIFLPDRLDACFCSEACRARENEVKNIVCEKTKILNKLHVLAHTLMRLDESGDAKNTLDLLIGFSDEILRITDSSNLNKLRKFNKRFLEIINIHIKEQPTKVLRAI